MYLCRGHLDANTLAHESGHLALWVSEQHGVFPKTSISKDAAEGQSEPFCHLLGTLYAELVGELRERRLID